MRTNVTRIMAAACLLTSIFMLIGCETEPSEQIALTITPNNVKLRPGQSQEFTASGLQDYTWSISETENGVLSTRKGRSTVYTAVSNDTNTIQVLRVSGMRTGTSPINQESPQQSETYMVFAEAIITTVAP